MGLIFQIAAGIVLGAVVLFFICGFLGAFD